MHMEAPRIRALVSNGVLIAVIVNGVAQVTLGPGAAWARAPASNPVRHTAPATPYRSTHHSAAWRRQHNTQDAPIELLPVACLVIAVIVFFSYLSNGFYRMMGWLPAKGQQTVTENGEDEHEGEAELLHRDPGWDRARFLEFARDAFGKVQDSWSRDDLPAIRHLLSTTQQEHFETEQQALRARGVFDHMDNVRILDARILQIFCDETFELVEVEFDAEAVNYRVDRTTHVRKEGSTAPERFSERWTFERRPDPAAAGATRPWVLGEIVVDED